MSEFTELYFYGLIPCKVRSCVVDSLLDGDGICGEPIIFSDNYTIEKLNEIAKERKDTFKKYTKEKSNE